MVIGGSLEDTNLRDAIRRMLEPCRAQAREVILRGMRSGELRNDLLADVAVDVFYSPLFYQLIFQTGPVSPDFVDAVCDAVVAGMRAR